MDRYSFNKERHEHYIDGKRVPGVTTILKEGGAVCFRFSSEDAIYRGNYVHDACHLWNQSNLNYKALKPEFKGYVDAWIKFLADTKAICLETEKPVYSIPWRYAGILDNILEIKGRTTLVDIKTGAQRSPAWKLQTAGYKIAYKELTGKTIRDRLAVQLRPDGRYDLDPHKGTNDENEFLSFLVCYNWKLREGIIKLQGDQIDD